MLNCRCCWRRCSCIDQIREKKAALWLNYKTKTHCCLCSFRFCSHSPRLLFNEATVWRDCGRAAALLQTHDWTPSCWTEKSVHYLFIRIIVGCSTARLCWHFFFTWNHWCLIMDSLNLWRTIKAVVIVKTSPSTFSDSLYIHHFGLTVSSKFHNVKWHIQGLSFKWTLVGK